MVAAMYTVLTDIEFKTHQIDRRQGFDLLRHTVFNGQMFRPFILVVDGLILCTFSIKVESMRNHLQYLPSMPKK